MLPKMEIKMLITNDQLTSKLQSDMQLLNEWALKNPDGVNIVEFYTEQSNFIQRMMILKNDLSKVKANLPKNATQDKQRITDYEEELDKLLDAYHKMDLFSPLKVSMAPAPSFADFKIKKESKYVLGTYATAETVKEGIITKFQNNLDYTLHAQNVAVARPKLLDVLKNASFEQRALNRSIARVASYAYEPEIRITQQFKQLHQKLYSEVTDSLQKAKNDLFVQKLAREEIRAAGGDPALKKAIALRAILDLNLNNPSMQKTGPKVTSIDAYLKTLLVEAYPDLFKLNQKGQPTYTDPKFMTALGDKGKPSFELDPKQFNFSSLVSNKKDPNHALFAVLYSTQDLAPVEKVEAYQNVASVIFSKKMSHGQDLVDDLFTMAISARAVADKNPDAQAKVTEFFEKDPTIHGKNFIEKIRFAILRKIAHNCKENGRFGDWLAEKNSSLYDALSKAKNNELPDLIQSDRWRTLNDFMPIPDSATAFIKPEADPETTIGRPDNLSIKDNVESGFEHPDLISLARAFEYKFSESNSTGIKKIITEFIHISCQPNLSYTEKLGLLTDTMKDIVTQRRDWKVEVFWSNRSLFGEGRGKEAKEMYESISSPTFDLTDQKHFNAFMTEYAGMKADALTHEDTSTRPS